MKKALSKRTLDADCRDSYGFAVRPQHLQTYREYATIYKVEGEERSHKWRCFLEQLAESVPNHLSHEGNIQSVETEAAIQEREPVMELASEGDHDDDEVRHVPSIHKETDIEKDSAVCPTNNHQVQTQADISVSLKPIEHMMIFRVEKRRKLKNDQISDDTQNTLGTVKVRQDSALQFEQECDEESCHIPTDDVTNIIGEGNTSGSDIYSEDPCLWKELEFLVHGGVPRYLRGEVWQAFVGVRARRIERYYHGFPDPESDTGGNLDNVSEDLSDTNIESGNDVPEKVRKQIEKVIRCMEPGLYPSVLNLIFLGHFLDIQLWMRRVDVLLDVYFWPMLDITHQLGTARP